MIERVYDNVHMVFSADGFTFSHALLIEDDTRLMIDSGVGSALASAHPENVDILINSHCHLDHISGNDSFTKAKKFAHPIEKESMLDPERTTATKGWYDLMKSDVLHHAEQIGKLNPRFAQPWLVDETINDNQMFDCGKTKFTVLHTPGHTQGHCSFHFPDADFIFTADICLSKVGPWYGDPDVTLEDFIASVKRLLDLKPKIIATGHVPHIIKENIQPIFDEYTSRIYKREKRIVQYLQEQPANIHELADRKPIYPAHPSGFVLFWEKSMIKKHVEKLLKEGTIEIIEGGRYHVIHTS